MAARLRAGAVLAAPLVRAGAGLTAGLAAATAVGLLFDFTEAGADRVAAVLVALGT